MHPKGTKNRSFCYQVCVLETDFCCDLTLATKTRIAQTQIQNSLTHFFCMLHLIVHVGDNEGWEVVGACDGEYDGTVVGDEVGEGVGTVVGEGVGAVVVGFFVGSVVGDVVGEEVVGDAVGTFVGKAVILYSENKIFSKCFR